MARTLEILDSFKLGDAVRAIGCLLDEQVVWAQNAENKLEFVQRHAIWGSETSFVTPCTAHQGHLEAIFLDGLKRHPIPVEVERAVEPVDMIIDSEASKSDAAEAYPVTVTVKHLNKEEADVWMSNAHTVLPDGSIRDEPSTKICEAVADGAYQTEYRDSGYAGMTEQIHAKYVLGSEGARSWVRSKLGIQMEGSRSESVWGVIDIIPITDYPDIRRQGPIITSKHEPLINVPRENGLSRIYVPLSEEYSRESSMAALTDPSRAVCKTIMSIAREAMSPYTLDYKYCDWYTLYKVGRRAASAYSDPTHRVFIFGDACHTHTPKGGQGMNVSMQDAYNLGWKIAGVIKGQLDRKVLATYESERRPIGTKLVELDEALSKGLGGAAEDQTALLEVYDLLCKFSDGRAVIYNPSVAVAEKAEQCTGEGLKLGNRLPNIHVRSQANSIQVETMDLLPSNGQWRLVVYGGDVTSPAQLTRVNKIGEAIGGADGLINRYTSMASGMPWLEVLLIHAAPIISVNSMMFHDVFRPSSGKHGGTSWFQIWADAPAPLDETTSVQPGSAHHALSIDTSVGAMALVRPDTFVGWLGNLEDIASLEKYCEGILKVHKPT